MKNNVWEEKLFYTHPNVQSINFRAFSHPVWPYLILCIFLFFDIYHKRKLESYIQINVIQKLHWPKSLLHFIAKKQKIINLYK